MTDKTKSDENLAKTDPAAFKAEEDKANDINNKQTDASREESGERNSEAVQEKLNRNVPQPKPHVILSRTNESEEEAKERGAKALARPGTNNEPGMDRPVPASTGQKAEMFKPNTDGNYDRLVEDEQAQQLNENGTPKAMRAKSDNEVTVRITKKGDGQVHTGGSPGDVYRKGDTPSFDRKIAEDLEERGFAEIED